MWIEVTKEAGIPARRASPARLLALETTAARQNTACLVTTGGNSQSCRGQDLGHTNSFMQQDPKSGEVGKDRE